ncbi:cytochrome c biogenesis protein ResB [Simplicispira hankyongi]|uniref:Cytochrome c biogenesis protein ResB n=1 Tax=Simplicispira hankyongi TaxID=2315688 RepID=A0A398CHY8_9BURK|nr:cytochrome c biogenesis protein ResB [Simplicispira hankyongi]RID98483.1 cytochrome c biogenesis protein ResB [Simplicispira hankyongi]
MSDTTQGVYIRSASQPLRRAVELLSSMRFAIALLTVICIASVIGTVLKQHEPLGNYVNQFGPFWAEAFFALQLNAVYSAWWFLLILAFLVVSTSLCIARNTPKIIADLRTYKENIREQNLRAFHHKAEAQLAGDSAAEAQRIGKMLVGGGWKVKLQQRDTAAGPGTGWMVAAKAGAANKIGYIAAHSAIVLVCLGGLLDGDMIVRAQMWLGGKTPYAGGGLISEVSPQHWMSERNPAYRGNLVVSEGTQGSTAILSQSDGILLQPLPFTLELKKFVVEYYSTGMPKLFASDVVLHDLATGEAVPKRIEVNHPASFKGIEIYQSSFDDGGSRVKLSAMPLAPGGTPFEVDGVIGGKSQLVKGTGEQALSIEFTGLRTINVENFGREGDDASGSGTDVRKVDLRRTLDSHMGAANNTGQTKELRNVGPSISYKLRDAAGQAREYNNYMLPVDMGKGTVPVFLLGARDDPAAPFRYLRVPADENSSIDGFVRLRRALSDPKAREQAVERYVKQVVPTGRAELAAQLQQSAERALTLFAGTGEPADLVTGEFHGGLPAISKFMKDNVPAAERSRAGEVLVRILNGTLFELAQLTRERAGLAPLKSDEHTLEFMTQAVLALSDVQAYPAPLIFALKDFTQVQASVFQVARSPGKKVVYLGCALLILGVFSMLFIRERRVWVWLVPEGSGSRAMMALSTNRKTMDGDREFASLTEKLIGARPTGGKA